MRVLHISSQPTTYWLAVSWLLFIVVVGVLGSWLPLPYSGTAPDLLAIAAPPGSAHYLGTDALGRDVLAGMIAGAHRLVMVTLPATCLATILGALAGGAAGFWGNSRLRLSLPGVGWLLAIAWWMLTLPAPFSIPIALSSICLAILLLTWRHSRISPLRPWPTIALPLDSLVLGTATLLGAVPRLIILAALAAGPALSPPQLLGLLAVVAWPEPARLVRAEMLRVRAQPFIEAAWASGLPAGRIWWHHALPAASQLLRATAPLYLAGLVGLESALAFLGIGQAPSDVSWGSLLATVRQEPSAWWVAVGPGLALLVTLLALQQVAATTKSH